MHKIFGRPKAPPHSPPMSSSSRSSSEQDQVLALARPQKAKKEPSIDAKRGLNPFGRRRPSEEPPKAGTGQPTPPTTSGSSRDASLVNSSSTAVARPRYPLGEQSTLSQSESQRRGMENRAKQLEFASEVMRGDLTGERSIPQAVVEPQAGPSTTRSNAALLMADFTKMSFEPSRTAPRPPPQESRAPPPAAQSAPKPSAPPQSSAVTRKAALPLAPILEKAKARIGGGGTRQQQRQAPKPSFEPWSEVAPQDSSSLRRSPPPPPQHSSNLSVEQEAQRNAALSRHRQRRLGPQRESKVALPSWQKNNRVTFIPGAAVPTLVASHPPGYTDLHDDRANQDAPIWYTRGLRNNGFDKSEDW